MATSSLSSREASGMDIIGGKGLNLIRNERLPTLYEVLNRQTPAPVDLWSFYVFMRDKQHAIDYLDFWIDIVAHLRLCKDYIKGLRQSLLLSSSLQQNIEPAFKNRESVSSSMLLEALINDGYFDFSDSRRVSHFLQGDLADSPHLSSYVGDDEFIHGHIDLAGMVENLVTKETTTGNRPNISRQTLQASAQYLVATYFKDGPKKLYLPSDIVTSAIHAVDVQKREDPEVFEEAKKYVFRLMEREAFPRFLEANGLKNLTGGFTRLYLSCFLLFAGFWVGYTLIFLDYAKHIRAVCVVPFFLGCYLFWSYYYKLDPVLVMLKLSEVPSSQYSVEGSSKHMAGNNDRIGMARHSKRRLVRNRFQKIEYPFIWRLLLKRSLLVLVATCVTAAALSCIFSLVPGHRL